MKPTLYVFTLILAINFGHCQRKVKTKTLNFSVYKLHYPSTWKTYEYNGKITLRPKEINKTDYLGPSFVYVFPNKINTSNKLETEEETLNQHASKILSHEKNKSFKVIKLSDNSKFKYKIEYDLKLDFTNNTFKKVEYVYNESGKLKYCSYLMREDFFDKYHDDAMAIINSIERR